MTSVDHKAQTVTIAPNGRRAHRTMFGVAPDAGASLAALKTGEQVRVSYVRTGMKRTAESISPVEKVASREPAPLERRGRPALVDEEPVATT